MSLLFKKLGLPGLVLFEPSVYADKRGFFLETFKETDFQNAGIHEHFVQDNHSSSIKNVVRGMHYQLPPFSQSKLIYVVTGSIFDVVVDIRRESSTFGKWFGIELNENNKQLLYIPEGFAHGFLALTDKVNVIYRCTQIYSPEHERGFRWDDPTVGIIWNLSNPIISEKDSRLPSFKDAEII